MCNTAYLIVKLMMELLEVSLIEIQSLLAELQFEVTFGYKIVIKGQIGNVKLLVY